MKKEIKKGILLFCTIVLLGTILNIAAFLLPQERIHRRLVDSIESFTIEGVFPELIHKYKTTRLDNNSDAWMLLMCDYNGDETAWEKAMGNYFYFYPVEAGLIGSANFPAIGSLEPSGTGSYSRDWHGWLFFVRFLLLFFDYSGIRAINMFLQFILMVSCFVCLERKGLSKYILALIIAFLIIMPTATASCLFYSSMFYIVLISFLCMLIFHDKIQQKLGYMFFFMIIGMVTSYVDLLSYPIFTLGMPLTLFLILNRKDSQMMPEKLVKCVITYSIFWGIGYAGMWISKWVVGSLILRQNLFAAAISQVLLRISHTSGLGAINDEKIGYFSTMKENVIALYKKPYILLLMTGMIVYCRRISLSIIKKDGFVKFLPYFLVAIMPFVWWYVAMDHSYIHNHFTYRSLAVTIFATLSGLCMLHKFE